MSNKLTINEICNQCKNCNNLMIVDEDENRTCLFGYTLSIQNNNCKSFSPNEITNLTKFDYIKNAYDFYKNSNQTGRDKELFVETIFSIMEDK